jgi:ribosomal protein L37AE/L43A
MNVQSCPCCGKSLLEHVRSRQLYWLCTSCSFEMPIHTFDKEDATPVAELGRSRATRSRDEALERAA